MRKRFSHLSVSQRFLSLLAVWGLVLGLVFATLDSTAAVAAPSTTTSTCQAYTPGSFNLSSLARTQALVARLSSTDFAVSAATGVGPTQSHDPANPGSDVYPYASYTVSSYSIWNFSWGAVWPTNITYMIPTGTVPAGGFPVISVSPGKFLDDTALYDNLLRHMTRKGYIVLFIDADTGPLDCQHARMAGEFLKAVKNTIQTKLTGKVGSPPKVAWWGHSMGAKYQAIAAQMTSNSNYIKPTAVISNNFSNDKALCSDDALATAGQIPSDIWYTIIRGDLDDIAKTDPASLYNAMPQVQKRQLLTLVSYPNDNLTANHYGPMTASNLLVTGTLDSLDWWMYWKVAVGAYDYHFKSGASTWAYGPERIDGGIDSLGVQLWHQFQGTINP